MEESDIRAPLYYVLGRKADTEEVCKLLTITPCSYGIACNVEDKVLLGALVTDVLQAHDVTACKEIAEHVARTTQRPVLMVGEGNQLKAVYSTGEEETLC